jgi:hypothetical protein
VSENEYQRGHSIQKSVQSTKNEYKKAGTQFRNQVKVKTSKH